MNGTFDPGDPATVLLGGGGGWSTGALISPRVILTCGHCVDPQGEPRRFAYFGSSYLDGGTIGGALRGVGIGEQEARPRELVGRVELGPGCDRLVERGHRIPRRSLGELDSASPGQRAGAGGQGVEAGGQSGQLIRG